MIEINLLPGSVKRTKRKASINLSAGPLAKIKLPPMDKFVGGAIGMWVVAILLIVYMQTSSSSRYNEALNADSVLIRDTANLHTKLELSRQMQGTRDTIATKLEVIQNLDAGRFDWAHILDEISRALPEYTWLTSITPMPGDDPAKPTFKIEGRMANAFALPKFMTDLEASPFITGVTLKSSGPSIENQHPIYQFIMEATYEEPGPEAIHTAPLFGPEMADSAITEQLTNGTAAAAAAKGAPPPKPPVVAPGQAPPRGGNKTPPPAAKPVAPKKGGKE